MSKDPIPLKITGARKVKKTAPTVQAPTSKADADGATPAKPKVTVAAVKPVVITSERTDAQEAEQPMPTPAAPQSGQPQPTVTAASADEASLEAHQDVHPDEPSQPSFERRARHMGDLLYVYAQVAGAKPAKHDLVATLLEGYQHDDQSAHKAVCAALNEAGLGAEPHHVPYLAAHMWPALAYMSVDQYILVLSQEGNTLTIYDPTQPDNRAEVPVSEFAPYYSGTVIQGDLKVSDTLAASTSSAAQAEAAQDWRNHWFWGEFVKYKRQILEVGLGSFVANMLALSIALFSLQVYDRVIPHQSEATLWVLASGAVIALVLEGMLKFARSRLMDGAGRAIEVEIQGTLMKRLLGMRSDLQNRRPTEAFAAMRDFGAIREFFTTSTIGTVADIPFIFLFLIMVSTIGGPVVWVLLIGGVLMVIPGFFLQKRMMRLTQEMQGASVKSARLLQEVVFEIDTIKSLRGEDRFAKLWSQFSMLSSEKSSQQRKLASLLTYWSQGVQQATYLGAVIAGTYLVFQGALSVGSIIAIGILTGRTLGPLSALAGTLARWSNVKSALDALDDIAMSDQDQADGRTYLRRDVVSGQFELRGVRHAYSDQDADVLDLPGVMIKPGQSVALLGPNGSGKSTLLRLLSGLYSPMQGKILLDGTDINQIAPKDLRRIIGYLGQDVRLFSGTLRENLNLAGLEHDDDRLYEALDFAGLGQHVRQHPKGLDLEIGDGGTGLSVGQRQSVGWARLWLQDPQICLLDEPTAALDQTLETAIISRLGAWLDGRTSVIATHRVPILTLMDRTLVLQNGRLAVDGPREQVLEHLTRVTAAGGK